MKIMVIGGAGYIGSRLVPALQEKGHDVAVYDLLWFGNQLPKGTEVHVKNALHLTVDDFFGVDRVIFLGGLSNDPQADFSPALNFVQNGAVPTFVGYTAKRAGVRRMIYGSTCSVYGFTEGKEFTEEDHAVSRYPYGIGKLCGEFGVQHLADDDFSVISLRQGTVSGFSPRMRFDLLINTMYRAARLNGKITVNNPTIWRPILAIEDAVQAYIRAVEAEDVVSGVFNVGSVNHTILETARQTVATLEELRGEEIHIEVLNKPDVRNYRVSFDKARQVLGFKPTASVASVVRELESNFAECTDFNAEAFFNIQVFQKIGNLAA